MSSQEDADKGKKNSNYFSSQGLLIFGLLDKRKYINGDIKYDNSSLFGVFLLIASCAFSTLNPPYSIGAIGIRLIQKTH